MKQRVLVLFLLASLSAVSGLAHADKLDDIQKAGVVRIAVLIAIRRLVMSIHKPKSWWVMT